MLYRDSRKLMSKLPTFITGNQNKADYFSRQMGLAIPHAKIDLDELQSTDLHVIVKHKLEQAYAAVGRPVLVEDVSLSFNALGDAIGPARIAAIAAGLHALTGDPRWRPSPWLDARIAAGEPLAGSAV